MRIIEHTKSWWVLNPFGNIITCLGVDNVLSWVEMFTENGAVFKTGQNLLKIKGPPVALGW